MSRSKRGTLYYVTQLTCDVSIGDLNIVVKSKNSQSGSSKNEKDIITFDEKIIAHVNVPSVEKLGLQMKLTYANRCPISTIITRIGDLLGDNDTKLLPLMNEEDSKKIGFLTCKVSYITEVDSY